jgi:hypothetical protein
MNLKIGYLILCLIFSFRIGIYAQIYANSLDKIPVDWGTRPKFVLSRDYPKTLEEIKDNYPWKGVDFKTKPEKYLRSVLEYFYEGNIEVDFAVQKNTKRKWYHAPSLAWKPQNRPWGREFIRGLTRELTSVPRQLHPNQKQRVQNWAIGFYNPIGAYTIGKIWADTTKLLNSIKFEDNAVSAKLLFTAADTLQVPYLSGTKVWRANINVNVGNTNRLEQPIRLIQVDLAIKDSRSPTGWVFGTFIYDRDSDETHVWRKLFCIGVAWGIKDTEQWINKGAYKTKFPNLKLGKNGGLNGPVDNLNSSCMHCHGDAGSTISMKLDYSLQLERGIGGLKNAKKVFFEAGFSPITSLTTEEMTIDELKNVIEKELKGEDNLLIYCTLGILISFILIFFLFHIGLRYK